MPFIGEIRIFAGNFAPVGWEFCQGQLLRISENESLYQLIGTIYGGDGNETFALPDLQGRAPLHPGTDSFGTTYNHGETGGAETVTLTNANLPSHQHLIAGSVSIPALGENPGKATVPENNYHAITNGLKVYSTTADTNRLAPLLADSIAPGTMMQVQAAGGSQPHDNMQPYLVVNFIISLFGEFPSIT